MRTLVEFIICIAFFIFLTISYMGCEDKYLTVERRIVDAESKIKKRGRNIANKINKWFGGDDDYWKRGGGLR